MSAALITIAIIVLMFIALVFELFEPILSFFLAIVLLMVFQIINIEDAITGFNNKGVLTIAALFIIAGTIRKSPVIFHFSNKVLGSNFKGRKTIFKILLPVTLLSSFVNNTPVVSLYTPIVRDWCKKVKVPSSKILILISYTSIFGGILTLIGTSTNLVVSGLLEQEGFNPLTMFQLTKVAIFLCIIGYIYILFTYNKLLPNNKDSINKVKVNTKDYLVTVVVERNCEIIGKTVEGAGLRSLEGLYLIEINRVDKEIAPVDRQEIIRKGDELVFTGKIETLVQLQAIKGLNFDSSIRFGFEDLKNKRAEVVEAVISESFPYLHKTIKKSKFRSKYDAAVIAVIRNGERLKGKLGNVKLKVGDTVLLIAKKGFMERWGDSNDFYLINNHNLDSYLPDKKSWIPLATFLLIIILASFNILSILESSLLGLAILFLTKVIIPREALKMISWETLGVIALSFGLGKAMVNSGAADLIAKNIIIIANGCGVYGALLVIYIMTNIFTELITNNAAAVLAFPIAVKVSQSLDVSHMPFVVAVAIAASAAFSSPYGYQTNLMVYGLGGYKFKDFIKFGLPLNILFMIFSIILIPLFFKF
ncbi:MAG: SLC13 family permease [Firmicutes bacterium]|nr:SLC13 family permease [Bacillota bacterium]